jgi:hypothetical protein
LRVIALARAALEHDRSPAAQSLVRDIEAALAAQRDERASR